MLQLLILEKRTLLKGWMLSFALSLPFTFIPAFFQEGDFWPRMIDRVPWALLYAAGFGIFVCGAALYHNYERQNIKIKLFNKPAFKNLGFTYFKSGEGSLVQDLSFYLSGTHNGFAYVIDMIIDLEDHKKQQVVIKPVLEYRTNAEVPDLIKSYKQLLRRDFRFGSNKYQLEILLKPEEINAHDPLGMTKFLNLIQSKIKLKPV